MELNKDNPEIIKLSQKLTIIPGRGFNRKEWYRSFLSTAPYEVDEGEFTQSLVQDGEKYLFPGGLKPLLTRTNLSKELVIMQEDSKKFKIDGTAMVAVGSFIDAEITQKVTQKNESTSSSFSVHLWSSVVLFELECDTKQHATRIAQNFFLDLLQLGNVDENLDTQKKKEHRSAQILKFMKKWGTDYIVRCPYGGLVTFCVDCDGSSKLSATEVLSKLKEEYNDVISGKFKGNIEHVSFEILGKRNCTFTAVGGNPEYTVNWQTFAKNYKLWRDSVKYNVQALPQFCTLLPLSQLFPNSGSVVINNKFQGTPSRTLDNASSVYLILKNTRGIEVKPEEMATYYEFEQELDKYLSNSEEQCILF